MNFNEVKDHRTEFYSVFIGKLFKCLSRLSLIAAQSRSFDSKPLVKWCATSQTQFKQFTLNCIIFTASFSTAFQWLLLASEVNLKWFFFFFYYLEQSLDKRTWLWVIVKSTVLRNNRILPARKVRWKLAHVVHEAENGISDYISQIDFSRALKNVLPRA